MITGREDVTPPLPPTGAVPPTERPGPDGPPPSIGTLMRASALALGVALLVLVVAVLPAEYGVDPTGLGRALGFAALSQPPAPEAVAPPEGSALAPTPGGPFALYPRGYQVDAREFELGPYEYLEFKYHLAKDATMLFSWEASADVNHDFHGVPDGAPSSAEQSYDRRARRRADGTFVAPFSGIHGWFWENLGGETVTVRLTTSGFYTSAHEFHYDGSKATRGVRSSDAIPLAIN